MGTNLAAVVQSDSVFIATKQRPSLCWKQTIMFHLQRVQVVIDVTDAAARWRDQMNTWQAIMLQVKVNTPLL